ncbi:hypothetical protein G8E10_24950 [Rhizobiaceae bacterium CRRU44]|uniref:Uncharacterized protein n=1 Tax=Ferranicluibacter rubi TaxID=2715133 RepID=A0AA43ZLA7_9HYPH|nr:hypothetical protein [Ferranicluibacter rubi]NHT78952.1 hypothetical protein [Ferranicluibacter rubi]
MPTKTKTPLNPAFHPPTMPPEGIPVKNTWKVGVYLKEVHGKAVRWTAKAEDITAAAKRAEDQLRRKPMDPAHYVGAVAEFVTAGPTAPTYTQAVAGTRATLIRGPNGWRLIKAQTVNRFARDRSNVELLLTFEQMEAMAATTLYRATGERADA